MPSDDFSVKLAVAASFLPVLPGEPSDPPPKPSRRIADLGSACHRLDVRRSKVIRLLIAFCLMAGLLAGRSAFAAPSHVTNASMSDDMDCCPKKPAPKCPLMAMCSAALPAEASRTVTATVFASVVARDLPTTNSTPRGAISRHHPDPHEASSDSVLDRRSPARSADGRASGTPAS